MREAKKTRRDFLRRGAAGAAALAAPGLAGRLAAGAPSPPNILFVFGDQFRAQALSSYGDPNIETTNFDALGAQGVRMRHCYSNSPLCGPFRSILMTGRYPQQTGIWQNNILLPFEEHCVAEAFVEAGYSTGYIGKWHLDATGDRPGYVEPGPRRQGWEYFAGFNSGHNYFDGRYFLDSPTEIPIPVGSFEPNHQTDLAIDWIDARSREANPWFLMMSWGPPHSPLQAPQEYMDMFDPNSLILRPNVNIDTSGLRENLRGYYALIKNLDDNFGRLMQALEDRGLSENTLVVFTADHGDMLSSQGQGGKTKPWEESIGVPFVARLPGRIPEGLVEPSLFGTVDIYPTLCGLAGIPVPDSTVGMDLSHVLRGEPGPRNDRVFLTIGAPTAGNAWRGVRTDRFTYAWTGGEGGQPWVLYDNLADPFQFINLAEFDFAESIREPLHEMMLDFLRQLGDPFLPTRSGARGWDRYA